MKRRLRLMVSVIVRVIVREPKGPRPPAGTRRAAFRGWRERRYYHLSKDEWHARLAHRMPLRHRERIAQPPPGRGLRALQHELWPTGWEHVLVEHWRQRNRGGHQ